MASFICWMNLMLRFINFLWISNKHIILWLEIDAFFCILDEFRIPMKLIRLAKDAKWRILVLSDPFSIDTRFKQGDHRFCALLFNLAFKKAARGLSINWNGTFFNTSKQLMAFADDSDLFVKGTIKVNQVYWKWTRRRRKSRIDHK